MLDIFPCAKAKIIYNPEKKTAAELQKGLGCDYLINGGFFDFGTFKPTCWLVLGGKVISRDSYNDWGFVVEDGKPKMLTDHGGDFLSLVPLLKNGKLLERTLTPDVARAAKRSAVGWTEDGRIVLAATESSMTRGELGEYMIYSGAVDAFMCDGGGSVQAIMPGGTVTSSRKVPTLMAFWKGEYDVSVKTFSLKKQGSAKLSENFAVREFACHDGTDTVLIADDLVDLLQAIRTHFGAPVTINSAYRTPSWNAKQGGAPKSQHLLGKAADVTVKGVPPLEVAQYVEYIQPSRGGIGVYQSFTHVDVRDERARWDNRSGKEVTVAGWPGYVPPYQPTEAELAVKWATQNGIMHGNADGDLMLDQPLTRQQAVTMLYRFAKMK